MNLVVDQGNSVCKVAICQPDKVIKCYALPRLTLVEAERIIYRHPEVDSAIYSTVKGFDKYLLRLLKDRLKRVLVVDPSIPVPLEVRYDRNLLGSDRLAAVIGACELSSEPQEVLVIDSGTAITFDRVSAEGIYLGGNISLGLWTRIKALHHFTSKLPLIEEPIERVDFGVNTAEAISGGVLRGLVYEIDGYINELKQQYPEIRVYITGGDVSALLPHLKNKVFPVSNLVIRGLNRILEYNKNLI